MSVAFVYSYVMNVNVQHIVPLFAYFVLKLLVLCQTSLSMLHSILSCYYPFIVVSLFCTFCFPFCVYCDLYCYSLCMLLTFAFCLRAQGPMPTGGNPVAVNKYLTVPYLQHIVN